MRPFFHWTLFAFFLVSCGGPSGDKERSSRIFGDYLKERFDEKLPEERSHYLIIPHGCQGVIVKSLREVDSSVLHSDELTLIASNEKALSQLRVSQKEVLMDREGELDRLALPLHNLTLLIAEEGKVKRIVSDKHCNGKMGERIEKVLKSSE